MQVFSLLSFCESKISDNGELYQYLCETIVVERH